MGDALRATALFCGLFWPWLAAGVTAVLAVHLVDRDGQEGVPEDLRAARGVVLGTLLSLSVFLVFLGGLWLTWRT
jgi:hypothetical protein